METKVDEVTEYYKPIEKLESACGWLFWLCALLSLIVPYSSSFPYAILKDAANPVFLGLVLLNLILSLYLKFVLIPKADYERRKQLFSDSFGVSISTEKTQGYYNNELPPSLLRLGANTFENSYFGKEVCAEMAKEERKKVLIYFVIWIIAISFRNTEISLVVCLTQLLFSEEMLIRLITVEKLRSDIESVYNDFYSLFLNRIDSLENKGIAQIMNLFSRYECCKAFASIKQSTEIFNKLNSDLSKRWEEIKKSLKVNEQLIGLKAG